MAKFREKVKRNVDALQIQFSCTFDDGAGNLVEAGLGDWLVTEADGTQCIMDCDEFDLTFEAVAQKGPRGPRVAQDSADESAD